MDQVDEAFEQVRIALRDMKRVEVSPQVIRTLEQLQAELADLGTGLESARLSRCALAVAGVLRELKPPDWAKRCEDCGQHPCDCVPY